jgi:aspartate carbamoyltransferase catalytic subunit
MNHILSARQFFQEDLEQIFGRADSMKADLQEWTSRRELLGLHAGEILGSVFYEPSTRTRFSFESAAKRLGMEVIGTENASMFSSAIKGETLEDTVMVSGGSANGVVGNSDVIVLRHNETGGADRAAAVSTVPIINAGDGKGEHPTQSLLDLYTIKEAKGRLDDLHVVIGGDLKHGRTARSLAQMLSLFPSNKLTFVSTPEMQMGDDVTGHLDMRGIEHSATDDMYSAIRDADVVYWTRLQRERLEDPALSAKVELGRMVASQIVVPEFPDELREKFEDRGLDIEQVFRDIVTPDVDAWEARQLKKLKDTGQESSFVIDQTALEVMRQDAVIMHPLPRVDEIHHSVDRDPRAWYFRQADNGLPIRMALIDYVLKES